MPSWPVVPTMTPTPFATVAPRIPAMKVFVCVPDLPIRIVLASPATPSAPISMLLLPVVRLAPAWLPTAMLDEPVLLFKSAFNPSAVLSWPVVLKKVR